MRASCSSELIDDFDDFNEKPLYCPSTNSISLRNDISNNDFPFDDEFCDEILKKEEFSSKERLKTNISKTIEYDQQLANLISNELGLNDPQTSRKNAWGNLSYAELITKAILNSEQQRLTLSQIYSWIILYVPYFRDKSDKKSSQGWKNSIRHNLSLHNRFVRIPNEIAGKSSWWTIDLRAKLNRGRKKNLSNENSTKKTCKSSFTSVRDFNQSFYSNLQNQTNPNILHDMLKSSSSQISNQNFNNRIDCEYSSNLNNEDDQIKLKNKLKTMDRSNPLFRRMFLKLMRIQMNENKLNNQRNDILSTPPPSSIQFNNLNSTLDFDIQTILHFEQTTFGDDIFDIQDLPNL